MASDSGSSSVFLDLRVLSAPRTDGLSRDLKLDLGGSVVLRLGRG
ncbi:hypothetical protein ABC977_12425 [Thioalkalicoccus limnaeus]|uniref:Uncharacterized protein n=1 Tax=Thioalkalicoccus limnaeus TaxID=120681 RepID=A0ABV4BG09_9GAMM